MNIGTSEYDDIRKNLYEILQKKRQENYEYSQKILECSHVSKKLTKYTATNKVLTFRTQCLRCGHTIEKIKKSDLPIHISVEDLPDFDEDLRHSLSKRACKIREGLNKIAEEKYNANVEEEFSNLKKSRIEKYQQYLESSNWGVLRSKVFTRCNRVCEGCLCRPATEVHHLTYDHICDEYLWELVGICGECHRKIHNKDTKDPTA